MATTAPHRIVIVGGGAGGLELATRLGDRWARGHARTSRWSSAGAHALLEAAPARDRRRQHGPPRPRDRLSRAVALAPFPLPPRRDERARPHAARGPVGAGASTRRARRSRRRARSPTTRWSSPSAASPTTSACPVCRACDRARDADEADRFHRRLVNACIRAHAQGAPLRPGQLRVAIVGAGATGVELAAELHKTTRMLVSYGLDRSTPSATSGSTLVEAGRRILPACRNGSSAGGAAAAARARRARCTPAPASARSRADGVGCADGDRARRTHGLGGRRQGADVPARARRAGDQPDQPARRAADAADDARRRRSSRSAIAPPAPGSGQRGRTCRRAPRPPTSRRRTW